MQATHIEISAEVRYWDDATVNGTVDADGTLIPLRKGSRWAPIIRLADGTVMDWPQGTKADIHYKVCDQGEYWLLDDYFNRVAKWAGYYVPDEFLCPGDNGYGDYIILKVGENGLIANWKNPEIKVSCHCDEGDESGWAPVK